MGSALRCSECLRVWVQHFVTALPGFMDGGSSQWCCPRRRLHSVITVIDRPWTLAPPSVAVMLSVLALAVLSTALAYVIFFRILASAGAVNASLVTLLIPVSAILLGTPILDEELALPHYAGMVLGGIGLAAIDGRVVRYWRVRNKRRQAIM